MSGSPGGATPVHTPRITGQASGRGRHAGARMSGCTICAVASKGRKNGDARRIRVVPELRETLDRDMLSTALFGMIMSRVRAEKHADAGPTPPASRAETGGEE